MRTCHVFKLLWAAISDAKAEAWSRSCSNSR
jgi:hypothetical protein